MFGAVKLTENADTDMYKYSGYGIGFYGKRTFSFPRGRLGCNLIVFRADMSSSVHAEKKHSINFTKYKIKFCLSLHYNGANSYLFVNGTEFIKSKSEDSEIVATPLF